ncbi:unnamed protein product [Polarella glacialis]|uniref:Uncharacterized protein n=1 Tax=Polarella glacialis TaxID=89957 RepID=A0A813KH85_POLGL|nr:unnamed protein product [Polarella glacialis]
MIVPHRGDMSRSPQQQQVVCLQGLLKNSLHLNWCLAERVVRTEHEASDSQCEVILIQVHSGVRHKIHVHAWNIWPSPENQALDARWDGHLVKLTHLDACNQHKYPISQDFANALTGNRFPHQFKTLQSGHAVPLKTASGYHLRQVQKHDDGGTTWLLESYNAKETVEAVYNGALEIWQHQSIMNKLCYEKVRAYCYLGFQPPWRHLGNGEKYGIKVGFRHFRVDHVENDLMKYMFKKLLMWFLEGSGLFYFPSPQIFSINQMQGRRAEQDLMSLLLNMSPQTVPTDSFFFPNKLYASGEYFLLDSTAF